MRLAATALFASLALSCTRAQPERPTPLSPRSAAIDPRATLTHLLAAIHNLDAHNSGRGAWNLQRCSTTAALLRDLAPNLSPERAASAHFAAAIVLERCSMTALVERELAAVLHLDPLHCGALARSADLAVRRGQHSRALAFADRAPRGCIDAHVLASRALRAIPTALADAERRVSIALRMDNDHPAALHELALIHLARSQPDNAARACDHAIRSQIDRGFTAPFERALVGELYNTRGQAQLAEHATASAIESFRRATEFVAAFEPWMNLGLLLIDVRDFSGASTALARAVEFSASDEQRFDAMNAMGVAARGEGDIDRAIRLYRSATHVQPERPEPYCNAALALAQRGANECDAIRGRQWFARCVARVESARDRGPFGTVMERYVRLTQNIGSPRTLEAAAAMNSVPSDRGTFVRAPFERAQCPCDFE